MGFRDFATDEAATLIRDLLTKRVETPRTELKSLRRAFDEAVQALDAALAIHPIDVPDAHVAALAARLTAAAVSETEDAVARVRVESQARMDVLQAELERHVAEGAARATSLAETAARLEAEEAARSAALADVARLTMQLEIEAAEAAAVRVDLARVTEERNTEAAGRAAARDDASRLATQLEAEAAGRLAALADVERLTQQIESDAAHSAVVSADRLRLVHQLEVDTAARQSVEAELRDLFAQRGREAAERASSDADLVRISHQLEGALSESATLRADLAAAQRQLEAAAEERGTLTAQLQSSTARIEALEADIARQHRLQDDLRERLEASLDAESARREQDDHAVRAARRAALAVDRLRDGIREISGAATAADALTAVASALAADFDRRAVFSVNGNRLEGRYQAGFDVTSDISKVVVPLTMDSLLAQAVSSNRVESLSGSGLTESRVPFGGSPACVLALPVSVHGQVVAVVYADDGGPRLADTGSIEQSTTFADLLRHYAAVHLEVLATEQKSVRELREYAKLLVDEVDRLYRADVDTGGEGEWLRTRLQENLQCVREIYGRRAALEGPAAAGLLEEQIAACIRTNGTTPFGCDLAAAIATGAGAVPSATQAAQAS